MRLEHGPTFLSGPFLYPNSICYNIAMHHLPPWARRHFLTVAFIAGFITDLILLNRVEDIFDNLILLFYVLLSTLSIILLYLGTANKVGEVWSNRLRTWSPMTMQYAFGGLLSGMLIFYGRSGDPIASWPFFLLIAVVIIGNEVISRRDQRLLFILNTYLIGIFSYIVLIVPVFTGQFGPLAFVLSGLAALLVVYGVVQILLRIVPNFLRLNMRFVVFSLLLTYIGMNTLYFTNIIPPIPLSLKEITIAHDVVRTGSTYHITYEASPRWQVWRRVQDTFHPSSTRQVSCFASVFAPSRVATEVTHIWEYRDGSGRWQEYFRLSYPISAVGDRGFRGYTTITNFWDGEWRCRVTTPWGQIIGQQRFIIDSSVAPVLTRKSVE